MPVHELGLPSRGRHLYDTGIQARLGADVSNQHLVGECDQEVMRKGWGRFSNTR